MDYDVFISHASDDKITVARPLATHLKESELKVWLDEFELTLGDSLRRTIDRGLARSRFGVVILSPAFFLKEWPQKELDGLVAREDGRNKVILPIWHNIGSAEIVKYSPVLADKLAVSTSRGLDYAAQQIVMAVRREGDESHVTGVNLTHNEDKILEQLRQRMISAQSSWQLREILYEVEAYLAQYPHQPNARLLKDRIFVALHSTEKVTEMTPRLPPCLPDRQVKRSSWLLIILKLAAIVGSGYYIFYLILKKLL